MTRIEKLFPNGKYRVETVGVGMARTFDTLKEAYDEAQRLRKIFGGEIMMVN